MPWIAILVGLLAGLAVWSILDHIQSFQVDKIFRQELQVQLDLRARESLIRFDRYLSGYSALTQLLANHRQLSNYLETATITTEPLRYTNSLPPWLPNLLMRTALELPSQILLTDLNGRVREIFQTGSAPAPIEIAHQIAANLLKQHDAQAIIERIADHFYLISSATIEHLNGHQLGYLITLVPINDRFLAASQHGLNVERAAVALVDEIDQRLIASVDATALPPSSQLENWNNTYVITTQSLDEYAGQNSHPLFATFVPHSAVEKMSRHVRIFERRQRLIAALVFVVVFTVVIYLVSARLNKVLKRMTRFSQRALGIAEPGFDRDGNQLLLLEDWIRHFTQLVLTAREEMNRKHQEAMRESEALKAAMMEASLDAIVTLNRDGQVIEFNRAAERLFSVTRQEALNVSFAERFLPNVARAAFKRLLDRSRHLHRQPQERCELLALLPNNIEHPVEISIALIGLDDERFYTLYIHDISSRKQAEQEIKSLARFASESPNPIMRVTAEGLIVYANNASRPLLLAWQTTDSATHLPSEWREVATLALGTGQPLEREFEVAGQLYSLLFAPIRDLGYINLYARDITAVRRAEQESRQHQAELVHVCRLSTLGEVATGMAHELNQPLSAIVNYANGCTRRLQGGSGQIEELIGAMNQITAQAQRASEIIRRLRALVGKKPPSRALVDLNQLVREVRTFLEFDTNRLGIDIDLDLFVIETIPVRVDLVQIEQVLLNLVSNALDALEERPEEQRQLCIRTEIREGSAWVVVEDTGLGIAPERLGELFNPFVTTKDTGMGMGLAISQTIIDNHEGKIWAESELGRGAAFYVTLPLATTAQSIIELTDSETGER
ncbi:PAS domain-containing sensor histidine kinase [Chromatium weissei]|nr:PAS domain-containing sensor histidine kinase [Chromatium weissei]